MKRSTFNPIRHNIPDQELHPSYFPTQVKTVDEDGNEIIDIVMISEQDFNDKLSVPKEEDYKLKDLLSAGVPLKDVAVNGLLDSSDFAEMSIKKEKLTSSMLAKVSDYLAKQKSENVEPQNAVTE